MKHLAYILPMAAAFVFAACDNIEDDERWGEKHPIVAKKNVLIEDFTGQRCVNCPNASNLIHEFQFQSGSIGQHVIAVSIHGGSMSYSVDKLPFGLATEIGEEYNTHWGVKTWPNGMVDRVGGLQEYTQWATSVAQRLIIEPAVNIAVSTDYDGKTTDTTWGTSTVTVTLDEATSGALQNASLNVWLTESNITARQLQPDGSNKTDYVHNHVLRTVLTDAYGTPVDADEEGKATWTATYDVPKVYGRESKTTLSLMSVVAFVTSNETGEVLQVVEEPMIK
ncbi:MAG: Omp28 family outer membrane lipoprotein [Alloprevotella sp.]